MIKLGANTVLFGGFDLATAMKHIAWAGYDGVELSAIPGMCEHLELDNWKSQVGDIQGLREEYGLDLLAMEATRLDPEWLAKAYEAAAAIGIPVINVGPGGKTGNEDDFQRQTDLLAAEADKAHAHGVMLCVKAHVGACIHDTPTTLRAMEKITSPGFGIDMDPSHIFRATGGENPVEALAGVISRVGHIHIRDCRGDLRATAGPPGPPEEQACGRGEIDLFGYIRVLHESGLDVAVNLEVIGALEYDLGQVTTIAAESRGYLNACLRACQA
ncbi:MAG: xylose isomerase [Gemmatimonadetes bacterium]|mgnify:FL=1|nr:xylose isomerase [Gemmatimonadota bacterium]